MTILLWGPGSDEPLGAVATALARRGEAALLLDQVRTLEAELELTVGEVATGRLTVGGQSIALEAVRAVYPRPDDVARAIGADPGGEAWRRAHAFEAALTSWLEITSARVVSRPSAMAANGSKPYQAAQIAAAGFDTPRTLIATDKAAILAFQAEHGAIVYKSISGVRSIVARLTEALADRLDDPAACPTQFQEQVAGTDVRVHVVGSEVFACEIISTADDYRYARAWETFPILRSWAPPVDLADRCRALTRRLGLEAAGIDLRRRPDGRWCCFEVNPSPGFTWYEQATGHRIADAIAGRLAERVSD